MEKEKDKSSKKKVFAKLFKSKRVLSCQSFNIFVLEKKKGDNAQEKNNGDTVVEPKSRTTYYAAITGNPND